jgi:ankyrin repeat protein
MVTLDKTPYEILDVPEDIDYDKLCAVYRTKIHEHLQKKISAINYRHICRAYETISDFDKRKHYDSQNEWISELPIDEYTLQQLAAEPDLIRDLKQRLRSTNLTIINAQDPITGQTTLYTAARTGNIDAVKFLTEQGADSDLPQRIQSTALHAASFYGHADIIRCLLQSGANHRIANSCGHTAEEEAYNDDVKKVFIELKQFDYVRAAANELDWFVKNGLNRNQDTEYFAQHQTLLHCASKKGYFDLVSWLIVQRSANMDLVDYNGNSALHLAAYGGHIPIVDYLLNLGCDPTLRNRWGATAEEEGSKHDSHITDLFKRMRERDMFEMARTGVDWWFYYYFDNKSKDLIDSKDKSLLYYACRFGKYSVAKWLLEHGANVNIQMKDKQKNTSLHGAKFRGHFLIVELLLEYGADVNIKNDFGVTVFDQTISEEVDENSSNKIKELLLQYQHNLKSRKLIDVYIYLDEGDGEEPIVKLQIDHKTVYEDLLQALPENLWNEKCYFSIAGRPLNFEKIKTRVISAVYCARYATSKLVDTPLRLTLHKTILDKTRHQFNRQDHQLEPRQFATIFKKQNESNLFLLKGSFTDIQTFNSDNLTFNFAANCIKDDVTFKVTTLCSSDVRKYGLPDAICFFKTTLFNAKKSDTLLELPVVSIVHQSNARLYTLAMPSSYWFSSETRPNQLPMFGGIHAFIRHVDIIPSKLTLPPDIFIAATLGQPLTSRDKPMPCTCLALCESDTNSFPHVAYHGTSIEAVRSILVDGLIIPGTVTTSGKRINPPKSHIARDLKVFDVPDFATAIFVSPSVYYSSNPTYARAFSFSGQILIPVLECSVKSNSFSTNKCTVSSYNAHPSDDLTTIEWRVTDPTNVEVNSVLFIKKIDSIAASSRCSII